MSSIRRRRWLSPQNAPGANRVWPGARRTALRCECEECEPRVLLSIAIDSVSVEPPGPAQAATADFTVSLDPAHPTETVTVDYATVDGTAHAGVDYTAASGTLTFAPGVTTQSVEVPVTGSATSAADPTFAVALSNPVNDTLAPGASEGTAIILESPSSPSAQSAPGAPAPNNPAPSTQAAPSGGAGQTAPSTGATPSPAPVASPTTPSTSDTPSPSPAASAAPVPVVTAPAAPSTAPSASDTPPSSPAVPATPVPAATATPAIAKPAATAPVVNPLAVINTNDTGPGSLRGAIAYTNANPGAGPITFDIPGAGPFAINPRSPLPPITHPVTIDATTQPGYHGTPVVALDGVSAGRGANGLVVEAGGSVVKGLAIERFSGSGIVLQSGGGNTVAADDLGTNAAGSAGLGNGADGVRIIVSADNTIGAGDVISGNGLVGVRIQGAGASGNIVRGDLIGTAPDGTSALGNRAVGVFIDGAPSNSVGGLSASARNVISANGSVGVQIEGAAASGNAVLGNFIGTDATGARPLGNARDGAFVDQAPRNAIGGSTAGAGNVIAASGEAGLQLYGPGARGNVVQGNTIGGPSLGNAVGLFVNQAPDSLIGGTATAANTIEDNARANVLTHAAGTRSRVLHPAGQSSRELSPLARSGNQTQGSIR